MVVKRGDAFFDNFFVRHVARRDREVGPLVDRMTLLDKTPDGRGGIPRLQQRTIGPAHHPPHDDVRIPPEPDRHRPVPDTVAGVLAHERPAPGRPHAPAPLPPPPTHPPPPPPQPL